MTAALNLTDTLALTRALIACPSVTPEDAGALPLLASWLEQLGFAVTLRPLGDKPTILNLFAKRGQGGPRLLLSGHTDVVPTGNVAAWRYPPFSATVADGYVWGRGACDMKSSIAAMVAAVASLPTNQSGTLMFLVTGDEEGPAIHGTAPMLEWMQAQGHGFDFCLNGEPTSVKQLGDTIKVGRRGSCSGTISVEGVQGHVAYPQQANNPVPLLLDLLQALRTLPLSASYPEFQPSNLEITTIDVGNAARNVIPAKATANFNIRYNPAYTHALLSAQIRNALEQAAAGRHFSLDIITPHTPAFLTQPSPALARVQAAITSVTGVAPQLSTSGGTSDARFIQAYGPVVDFGPTNATIHQTDERISLSELTQLTAAYRAIIEALQNP